MVVTLRGRCRVRPWPPGNMRGLGTGGTAADPVVHTSMRSIGSRPASRYVE